MGAMEQQMAASRSEEAAPEYTARELESLGKMVSYLARRSGLSHAEAEDVSQWVLMDLWCAGSAVRSPKAWAKQVTSRKIWKYKRTLATGFVLLDEPVEGAYRHDLGQRIDVARVFQRVSEGEVRLWFERCVLQRPLAELADEHSQSTLKRRLQRTRAVLRARLADHVA
jgi:DNA-directed RNA polymerase specialized sigma24 family protein